MHICFLRCGIKYITFYTKSIITNLCDASGYHPVWETLYVLDLTPDTSLPLTRTAGDGAPLDQSHRAVTDCQDQRVGAGVSQCCRSVFLALRSQSAASPTSLL